MVFFNDPLPCPDPALRAVRMAVAMRARVRELAETWRKHGYELGFGVGIAQGYATLGRIGFEGRSDYAAIGSVVNLAARLCGEAESGQIIVERKVLIAVEAVAETEPWARSPSRASTAPCPPSTCARCGADGGASLRRSADDRPERVDRPGRARSGCALPPPRSRRARDRARRAAGAARAASARQIATALVGKQRFEKVIATQAARPQHARDLAQARRRDAARYWTETQSATASTLAAASGSVGSAVEVLHEPAVVARVGGELLGVHAVADDCRRRRSRAADARPSFP